MRHLGETFDIHGGGMDLIFPHHENEIAQSCGATGKEFARYWVHNGFVQINQEKMSKSLGNFFTIREIFQKSEWPESVTGEMLRYFLLSTHYRSPLDFSDQSLAEAKNALNGFYDLFERLKEPAPAHGAADEQIRDATIRARQAFVEAMDDDLNTPNAVAALQKLRGESNKALEAGLSAEMRHVVRQEFRTLGLVLGLLQPEYWQFKSRLQQVPSDIGGEAPIGLSDEEIAGKIAARLDAKKAKNYKLADQLRAELASNGITLEDRPDGTSRWKR
jgi:cysteinyl-tRNA synthetase